MRRLELIMSITMILVAGLFYYLTLQLPEKAMIYPLFVITLLMILSLIQLFVAYFKKTDEESREFKDIKWKQLLFVLISSAIYIFLIRILGYVTSTFLYVLIILLGLKTNTKLSVGISLGFVIILYLLFRLALNVPLPRGFII